MNSMLTEIAAAALGAVTCDESGAFQGSYRFPESFAGFAGHFPGHPILPAIVEILTAVSLVSRHEGRRLRLLAVEDAKFNNPVRPGQELSVRCRPRTVKGKLLYEAHLAVADAATATLLLELAPGEELP